MKNFQNKAKIIKVSKIIRNLLFAGLVLEIILVPCFLLAGLLPMIVLSKEKWDASMIFTTFGMCLWGLLAIAVTINLFRFFDRLKNNFLFDAQTVGYLGTAGKWWIALRFYEGIFYGFGQEFFQLKMVWNSGGLFAGLILIFISWLLREAQGLQEEQELTV